MNKRFLIPVLSLILMAGCRSNPDPDNPTPDPPDVINQALETFKAKSDYGIYANGVALIAYDKTAHQIVSGNNNQLFRIQTDDQLQYVNFTVVDQAVTLNQSVAVGFSSKGVGGLYSTGTISAAAVKVTGGKMWLWEESAKRGVIIPVPGS